MHNLINEAISNGLKILVIIFTTTHISTLTYNKHIRNKVATNILLNIVTKVWETSYSLTKFPKPFSLKILHY